MDAFATLTRKLAAEAAARDALIARATLRQNEAQRAAQTRAVVASIVNGTYGTRRTYTDGTARAALIDQIGEARAAHSVNTRRKLALWTRRNVCEGGTYAHPAPYAPRLANHEQRRAALGLAGGKLAHDARWLIAQIRCSETRTAIAAGDKGGRQKRTDGADGLAAARRNTDGTQNHGAGGWRGLTPVREARHSARGKGGAALASKVSVRDAHIPASILAPLALYGVATHPDATEAQTWQLLAAVSRKRKLATYRKLQGAYVHVSTDGKSGKRTYGRLTPLALDCGVWPVWPEDDATEAHSGAQTAHSADGAQLGAGDAYAARLAQLGATGDTD